MSDTGIQPAHVQEGDLVDYMEGTAAPAVVEHVRQCPDCARQAAELGALQAGLRAGFYRFSCPPAEQLVALYEDELAGGEKLAVAQHVRQCPHCARELAAVARDERVGWGERFRAAVKQLVAVPVALPARTAPVRDAAGPAEAVPRLYRAGDLEVIVTLLPSQPHPRRQDLSALVHVGGQVPPDIGEARVELYQGDGLIAISHVSRRGQFTFPAMDPGDYDLSLRWADRRLWLKKVPVR